MRYSNRYKFQNWRIDSDGMLRVTARVLADGVFPYLKAESPDDAKENAEGLVGQYIPVKSLLMKLSSHWKASLLSSKIMCGEHLRTRLKTGLPLVR